MVMRAETIGNLLTPFGAGIIILDDRQRLLWMNQAVKTFFDTTGRTFKEFFPYEIDLTVDQVVTLNDPEGHQYLIRVTQIIDADSCHTVISLQRLSDFNYSATKSYCLETTLDQVNDGVVISDFDGKIVLYNRAMEQLEERSRSEMVGKFIWDAYGYKDSDQSEHRQVFNSAVPLLDRFSAHVYKNGRPLYTSYNTFPIVKDGERLGVFSICRNDTKLRELLDETIELKKRFFAAREISDSSDLFQGEPRSLTFQRMPLNNGTHYTFADIIGNGETTRKAVNEAKAMAVLESNILIIGETGTGKELYAQSIHNYSSRGSHPFIGINCAAIPETLLEGILFGTSKGAFTGALDKSGLFEEAGSGTVFLDELNSMPISMQTKLLRVLQERKFNRVGGTNLISLNCRVICAMNVDPELAIKEGLLRQDLYFRVAGLSLYLLPLREKKDEMECLMSHYIKKYNSVVGRSIKAVSEGLKKAFHDYGWPGNIREMEHVIENLMVRAEDSDIILEVRHLPEHLIHRFSEMVSEPFIEEALQLNDALNSVERAMIIKALKRQSGNLTAASRDLGIIRQSLIYRMKRLGIERPV
jgi:arginine utilization regulatory protein